MCQPSYHFKLIVVVLDPSLEKKKDLKSAGQLITERSNQFAAALQVTHHSGYLY